MLILTTIFIVILFEQDISQKKKHKKTCVSFFGGDNRTRQQRLLPKVNRVQCDLGHRLRKHYDSIVESLNLTDNMRIALECRQNGLSYPEITAILESAQSTVFEYFIKMRQRYAAIYG